MATDFDLSAETWLPRVLLVGIALIYLHFLFVFGVLFLLNGTIGGIAVGLGVIVGGLALAYFAAKHVELKRIW